MRALTIAAALACATPALATCYDDEVQIRGDFGQARFTVEIADDFDERAQGLMFRESMARGAGMLFLYDDAHAATFWMKNTLIPLDMIFIRPDGTIQHVHENAIPGDLTGISGGDGVIAVLEINGGLAARLGIAEGDAMQHPSFGADAILPCVENSDS